MEELLQNTSAYKMLSSKKGDLRHAYLLLFHDSKNLRTMLRLFAPLFFEENGDKVRQNRINSLIQKESFPDCLFFPEIGKKFAVENAETIEEECSLRPVETNKKLFVIGDFSESTKETQNKLLKMLEEPPENVHFLLGATSSFSVLPTVLSRVEKMEIPPFPNEEIVGYLKRNVPEIDADEATLCAISSGGIPGKAYDLATGGYFHELLDTAYNLCLSNSSELPVLIRACGETKYKKELLSLLKIAFFNATMCKMQETGLKNKTQSFDSKTQMIASRFSYSALIKAQQILSAAEQQIYFNGIFAQVLEVSMQKIYLLKKD